MNEKNLMLLENYMVLLEKALFSEYIKSANGSSKLKDKFKDIDSSMASNGFKYLNVPTKDQEVKILKEISRSNTFKAAAAGLVVGGITGAAGYAMSKLKAPNFFKKKNESGNIFDEILYEALIINEAGFNKKRKSLINTAVKSTIDKNNELNELLQKDNPTDGDKERVSKLEKELNPVLSERNKSNPSVNQGLSKEQKDQKYDANKNLTKYVRRQQAKAAKAAEEKAKAAEIREKLDTAKLSLDNRKKSKKKKKKVSQTISTNSNQDQTPSTSDTKPTSFLKKNGKSLAIGAAATGAGLLAFAKVIAKNTKHITLAGRKVYAIVSKDGQSVLSLALPYFNGEKVEVKYVRANMNSL